MIFNSVTFLLFLLVVVVLYWTLPYRARLLMLFSSSLIFYGFWRVEFLLVMLLSVVTDYVVALWIHSARTQRAKFGYLLISLGVNLGLLFFFKYLIFFADNVTYIFQLAGFQVDPLMLNIILPLGISFYTFQTISYSVDVYRGLIKPERDFVLYACYITYFPQLVAGPILRAVEVIPQLATRPPFSLVNIGLGVRRILYGLFLKVVLADNIAPLVDSGFAMETSAMSAIDVWTLAFLFGFQIYFDFSAYSHIALGCARMMGICFPENFRFPYLASSPRDFWRRWHISLSSWIRDYLYLPLAGIKVHDRSTGGLANATLEKSRNKALFLTWAIMGLWHGAAWSFVLWGLYHAMAITVYRLLRPLTTGLPVKLQVLGGMALTLPVMMLGWIPFRTHEVSTTFRMYAKIFDIGSYHWLGMRENVYLICALLLIGIVCSYVFREYVLPRIRRDDMIGILIETPVFAIIAGLVFIFLRPISQFIYFQF